MSRLIGAVQQLSLARNLEEIMAVVRTAARELTGADGATFVLRDGDMCHYADEDAISPLWKGQRFPMNICISGWTMLNRKPAVICDIYADPRIPADAYRPTFVKSLVMVPIRTESPIGAIGNYWAVPRMPAREEVELLQALANTTAVAMENVKVLSELEQRVRERTAQLEAANKELDSFSSAVAHDLASPLRSIRSFSGLLEEVYAAQLPDEAKQWLGTIGAAGTRMSELIDDLLRLSRVSAAPIQRTRVRLDDLAAEICSGLSKANPNRNVSISIASGIEAEGDPGMLRVALENLLSNAWKYTSKIVQARVEVGIASTPSGTRAFFVRDNGAGFEMQHAGRLFQPFQRLHAAKDFPGTGVGLATVRRIVHRHGGRIWAESAPGKGAAFYFTLSRFNDAGGA
jgi:signal transduction histidine kinase